MDERELRALVYVGVVFALIFLSYDFLNHNEALGECMSWRGGTCLARVKDPVLFLINDYVHVYEGDFLILVKERSFFNGDVLEKFREVFDEKD